MTCGLKSKGGEGGWPSSCWYGGLSLYHLHTCNGNTDAENCNIYSSEKNVVQTFLDLAKPQWCHSMHYQRNNMAKLTPACWETEILYLAGMLRNQFQICMNWFPHFPNAKTQWCNRVVSISSSFLTVLTRHHGFYFLEMGSQFNDLEEREETLWFTLVSGPYFMSAVAWNFEHWGASLCLCDSSFGTNCSTHAYLSVERHQLVAKPCPFSTELTLLSKWGVSCLLSHGSYIMVPGTFVIG